MDELSSDKPFILSHLRGRLSDESWVWEPEMHTSGRCVIVRGLARGSRENHFL